jgi:hypothetical protein
MMMTGRGLPRQRSRQQLSGQSRGNAMPKETTVESTSVSIDIPEHVAILMDGLDTQESPEPF